MSNIEIQRLKVLAIEAAKKIKVFEDVIKLKDQSIKKLQNSLKQKDSIIKQKNEQIQQMNALNPYWTDPVKQSQLVCKIMQRSQNPNLSINKEDMDKVQNNSKKIMQAFSLMYDMLKEESQNIYEAKIFVEKDPKFFIEQPLKLVELYKIVVNKLKVLIPQSAKQADKLQKIRQFEMKIGIYEKFASDLKEALQYCSFGMNVGQKGATQIVETKGLAIMQQNMIKLYNIRREQEKRYQKAGVNNFQSILKEHLLDYIENIRGAIIFCYQDIDIQNEERKKYIDAIKDKIKEMEKNVKQNQSLVKSLREKVRQGEIIREKDRFEFNVQKKSNEVYSFNLKSILLIAHEEVKRLQEKVNELEDKQMKLKEILKF